MVPCNDFLLGAHLKRLCMDVWLIYETFGVPVRGWMDVFLCFILMDFTWIESFWCFAMEMLTD